MRARKYLSLLCAVASFCLAAGDARAADKIFLFTIHEVTLDNGLKVVSIPYDSPGIVAYYTVVRVGSRNEVEPGKSGFAHFFEHMMFRGTDKYSQDQYNDILKSLGADSNAFTTDDYTAYHSVTSAGALETIIQIESDRFKNLKYGEPDFKKEAGAVLGEYNKSASNPFQILFEKLQDTAYTAHTYKHTTIGFLADIKDMPNQYAYSLQFFDRYYRPENSIILVVGDFKQEDLIALIKKYYGDWKRGSFKPDIPAEPPQKEEKKAHIEWAGQTLPHLVIGYHGPAFSDTKIDMPALDLLSQVAFSETSPLFQKLVIEQQKVEFISGQASDQRDAALFAIITRIKNPADADYVRDRIYEELERIKRELVSAERLDAIKKHLRYSFAMRLNSADRIAQIIAAYLNLTGDPQSVNRIYELYSRVTPADIQAAAQKYFTPENRTVITLATKTAAPAPTGGVR